MPTTDDFGGVAIDEPSADEFGGIPIDPEVNQDALRFAVTAPQGINRALESAITYGGTPSEMGRNQLSLERIPVVGISPYQRATLSGTFPTSLGATTGPANPQEVLNLPQITQIPGQILGEVTGAASDLTSDFLNRTGIDPSAMPGRNIVDTGPLPITNIPGTGISPLRIISPKFAGGIEKRAGELVSGFTEPGQAALLPLAPESKALQGLFAAQAASEVPESLKAVAQARNAEELGGALTGAGANATMAYLLGRGLVERPSSVPVVEEKLAQESPVPPSSLPTKEAVSPTATPTPEAPVSPTAPEVASLGPETADGKDKIGNPLGTKYYASPEDWAQWQEVTGKLKEAKDAQDTKAMFELYPQLEALRNKYGGADPLAPKAAEPVPNESPVKPDDLRAAVKVDGKVLVGEPGETHADILERNNVDPSTIPHSDERRGFVDVNKPEDLLSRKVAEKRSGLKGSADAGGLDSMDLPNAAMLRLEREMNKTEAPKSTQPANAPKGIAASVRNKWTSATEEPFGSEAGFINIDPIRELVDKATPYVKRAFEFTRDVAKEGANAARMTDLRRSVLNWSGKLQKSFDEAAQAQKEITKAVPDQIRRDGLTNYIQAGGDANVLRQRLAATVAWRDPVTGKPHPQAKRLIAGYEAALNLTPEEIKVADDVKNAYAGLGARGQLYDVLKNFKDNYVTQIWDLGKGPQGTGSSRTLRDKFKFSRASTFDTFFDGEQAGYVPKTKDISKLLPVYLHEMNSVIAARQLVAQLAKGTASDGRPLVVPRGTGTPVSGSAGDATLITPKSIKEGTEDYRVLPNQPALNDWKWVSKDAAGNPVFLKADLAIHPEAFDRMKAILGRSAIREWYSSKGSKASVIPKVIVQGIDMANSATKRTMLGLLSPFHQVQEATHAVGHRVNPLFSIPKVDLVNNAGQLDAAKHGLMLLPDRASADQFMEGLRPSGLVSRIPGIGPVSDWYTNYLFKEYIPGLKYKTYNAILERNMDVYAKDLRSGTIKPEDVKTLSAEQANAAFGHLNYADLGRNPTIQHIMQLGLLAPDFLEARARFTGQAIKGATGLKVGQEQVLALATLAIGQAALAYTAAKLTGGKWDENRPFEFVNGNRRYSMRSVPEDVSNIIHDTRTFIHSRISPLIGKGIFQYLSGRDYLGRKVTAGQTTKELLEQPIPISTRGFLGMGSSPLSGWEQLAGAVGLRISRYNPNQEKIDTAVKLNDYADNLAREARRLPLGQRQSFIRDQLRKDNRNTADSKKVTQKLQQRGVFKYAD